MLKIRIVPTLLYKNVGLVKGIRFNSWRRIGSLLQTIKVYSLREVDELIFLDVTATLENRTPDFELINGFANECFMPLTIGGGIKSVEDVRKLLKGGADKVAINSAAFLNSDLIKDVAKKFGSQCVVVSIDAKKLPDGRYEVFINSGTRSTGKEPATLAREVEKKGAGEILLTSIDKDGTMEGYDIELIKRVTEVVSIPVIASGGAGSYKDMLEAIVNGGAQAISAASIFHFTQLTPLEAKKFLKENNINVRI